MSSCSITSFIWQAAKCALSDPSGNAKSTFKFYFEVGVAKKTPSPVEAERKKLRPGSGGEKPPDEAPFTYQLKAVPLKFVKEIKDIVLTEAESVGSSAVFECLVSPSTAITTWMKDGSSIRESPKHRFTADGKDRKLHIADVQLSDAGEYTCVLRLGNKEKTSTAKLIVEGNFPSSAYGPYFSLMQ